ncbi:MAG: Spore coat polysaccharide biosynthesis protein SpsE [Candidatus Accumulibacter phosphatis]|uniref:Spore coat polysaccharide biosynthesis protein SpsE n=1 Tax=Candidatus Accumulibacter phosphatis TaxID=327160 RepID=A0A080LRN1_9PROT|nr:MAG: Spore coat polysaccharide biosynthesis protein SpsE [Candidatus Accumulibacter phosphatis]
MNIPVLIIAEAGVNHNGDMGLAKRLIDAAAEAGADLVKFQTFKADRLVTAAARKADYQTRNSGGGETQHEMLRSLELSPEAHHELIAHCGARGIGFFSTGFDNESVDFLASLGQHKFKIPSGEITNLPYLRNIGRYGREIILSTGMATLGDIEAAIDALEQAGTPRSRLTVLHCTTEYPTPMEEVNLRAMQSIGQTFGVAVGYSDHTPGIEVAIAATALGARVIEKHFTLDRNMPGPDHKASLEPDELKAMVTAIRNIETALGNEIKRLTPSEARNRPAARKSLVAARAIRAGDVFSEENLAAKRPGTGISPMQWDSIVGRIARRDFQVDEMIEL